MKKLTLLILCIATLGLASCEKETIIQEVKGRTYNFTINPRDWVRGNNGQQYSYVWNSSAIDQITFDDEAVLLYISHPDEPDIDLALPATYNSVSYSYRVSNSGVRVDIQSADVQATVINPPATQIKAKLVILPSRYAGN